MQGILPLHKNKNMWTEKGKYDTPADKKKEAACLFLEKNIALGRDSQPPGDAHAHRHPTQVKIRMQENDAF